MPKLSPVLSISSNDPDISLNNDTKPSEIIQQIVRAAKRRWSSPLLIDSLSSLSTTTTTTDQQTSKPINISVKRYLDILHLNKINKIVPVLFVRIEISCKLSLVDSPLSPWPLNSLFDLNCLFLEKEKYSSFSLYVLQLL
jgi:hypothetical protein